MNHPEEPGKDEKYPIGVALYLNAGFAFYIYQRFFIRSSDPHSSMAAASTITRY